MIVPDFGLRKPDSTFIRVVLPAPFGPMMPLIGCVIEALMLSKARTPPNRTVMSLTAIVECTVFVLLMVGALIWDAALYGTLTRAPFGDLEEDEWDRVLSVNVKGVWQMTRAASGSLKSSGNGSIINIASATVFSGSPQWMHYVASKGAIIAMTRVMARELGGDNVRANVIAPGITLTEASLNLMDDAKTYGANRAALLRNGVVDDISGGVLYLASDLSKYTTGQTLVIDGGKQFI